MGANKVSDVSDYGSLSSNQPTKYNQPTGYNQPTEYTCCKTTHNSNHSIWNCERGKPVDAMAGAVIGCNSSIFTQQSQV